VSHLEAVFHGTRFIVRIMLAATPLPQLVARTVYLDRTRDGSDSPVCSVLGTRAIPIPRGVR
jgi:hypothetical protein